MTIKVINLVPNLGKTRALNSGGASPVDYTALTNCYYWSSRSQHLITKAMLDTLGIPSGAKLTKLGWYVGVRGGSTNVMDLRMQVAHSALTALTTSWTNVTGLTYLLGTASAGLDVLMTAVTENSYNYWDVSAANFIWDGTNNLVFDMSRTDTTYTTSAGTSGYATAPGYGTIQHATRVDASTYPLTAAGGTNAYLLDFYMEWEYGTADYSGTYMMIGMDI